MRSAAGLNNVSPGQALSQSPAPGSAVAGQAYFVTNGEPYPFFRFVADVLNQLPHAALESLQLERANAQAKELQATARLVLFYSEEAP